MGGEACESIDVSEEALMLLHIIWHEIVYQARVTGALFRAAPLQSEHPDMCSCQKKSEEHARETAKRAMLEIHEGNRHLTIPRTWITTCTVIFKGSIFYLCSTFTEKKTLLAQQHILLL